MASAGDNSTPWGERQRRQQIDDAAKGAWVEVQKKAFTRWANSHLKQKGLPEIGDLFTDTSDGILLLQLLEVIGGDSIYSLCKRKHNPAPKFRIHKLENCNLIFEYLRKKELQLTNIGSADIVDANEKLLLGLMWTIILRFAVAEDGKQGLLLWLQRSTAGCAEVHNLDLSWRDGKAFLALIAKYRPDVLKFDDAVAQCKGDPHAQVSLAFQTASEHLGIPQLLDVEDVADAARPDEKAMVAYLSLFFNKFAHQTRRQALVDSVVKAVALSRKHEALIDKYLGAARALSGWIEGRRAEWAEGDKSGSTGEVKGRLTALQEYRKAEKVTQKAALLELTALLSQLRTSQRGHSRPLFTPPQGLGDRELGEDAWPAMEAAEQAYERSLIEKHQRFAVVDFALTKAGNKLAKLEPWLDSRRAFFQASDAGRSVSEAEARLAAHAAYQGQVDVYTALLSQCQQLTSQEELMTDEHALVAPTKERVVAAGKKMGELQALAAAFRTKVETALALEKDLVAAAARCGVLCNEVQFVLDQVEEAIAEPMLGDSVEEVTALEERFAQLVSHSFEPLQPKVEEVKTLAAKLQEHGRLASLEQQPSSSSSGGSNGDSSGAASSTTTTTSPDVLLFTHAKVSAHVVTHRAALQAAKEKAAERVEARQAFATAAQALNSYLAHATEASHQAVSTAGSRSSGLQVEEVGATLQALKADYDGPGRRKLAAAEQASAAQEEAGVVSNGLVTETIHSLRTAYEELGKLLDARLEDHMQAQAALQSQTLASAEQWAEVTHVFHALDRDRTGTLSNKEFRGGLQGLGVLVEDSEADRTFATLCKAKPGKLTLPEFGAYILSVLKAGSSSEDILSAFKSICNGDKAITADALQSLFGPQGDGLVAYMQGQMPSVGRVLRESEAGGKEEVEAYDYATFVQRIFER